jgi:hypothetical protein
MRDVTGRETNDSGKGMTRVLVIGKGDWGRERGNKGTKLIKGILTIQRDSVTKGRETSTRVMATSEF